MDYLSSYKLANGIPSDPQQSPLPLEMQRLQIEVQRRDAIIEEQQKRIFQLEDEVKRCNKQIQDLVMQLSQFKDQKPKQDQNYKPAQSRYWTAEEHDRFLDAVKRFGPKDVKAIASYVGTRNPTQVRTHAQKYYLRLERERKRKEESDPSKAGAGNSPQDSLENYNPDAKSPNDDSSTVSTPPDPNSIPSHEDEDKKNPRKRASSTGRRASMPADIASVHMKSESMPGLTPPVPSSTVVHSTRQQLQSAAPIVSSLKGWSPQEYNLFIEGLLSFPEEKDINKKCKLISEKFLPKYSPEDIKQCYAILHNYVRNKEGNGPGMPPTDEHSAYMEANKRLKTLESFGYNNNNNMQTYTTTSIGSPNPADMHPTLRYQLPYQNQQMRGGYPPYHHPYGAVPGYSGYPPPNMNDIPPSPGQPQTPYSDPSMMRRASYPMDTFSLNKTYPEIGENLFPPEFPTPWSTNENGPTSGPPTNTDDIPQENQRGNNL